MISARKAAANRRNASKSTGPKSVDGRNVARRNALKHGLTAETLVVEGEDAEAFRLMADSHLAVFRPRNDVEREFANTFSLAAWRRRRCVSTETSMVNQYIRDSQLAAEASRQQHVLALGDRLLHDSQGYWQLFPDPSQKGSPMSHRTNEDPGGPDLPARLVNELESTYEGCRCLLEKWNDLKVRTRKGNFWQALDKFKAIRLLGKQPLQVLEDTTGELLVIFLASYAIHPVCKSAFSELRCEVYDDQYPTVRKRLELLALEIEQRMPPGEDAARRILDDLIARHTRRLKGLVRKHKAQAEAEAAERTRRLAFDPGAAADKVRRYEDASIRRMTRACDDLAKLRRSGMLDEDADEEAESLDPARGLEPRSACELRGDIPDFARWKEPAGGADGASSAQAEETGCHAPPPPSETTVDGPPPTVQGDGPASGENTDVHSDAPPEGSVSRADAEPSKAAADSPRSTFLGNRAQWIVLLLAACCWWLVANGQGAALRRSPMSASSVATHARRPAVQPTAGSGDPRRTVGQGAALTGSPMSTSPVATRARRRRAQSEFTALWAGRAGSADHLTVAAPGGNTRGESDQTGEQRPTRNKPAARNEPTAIRSDSVEYSAELRSALVS